MNPEDENPDIYTIAASAHKKFLERSKEIHCSRPWLWNLFECVSLDITHRNFSKRLKRNAILLALIIGTLVLALMCSIFYCWCYYRMKFALVTRKYMNVRRKYAQYEKPGVIKLPGGEIRRYKPSLEEHEALTSLLQVLATVD